MAAIGGPPWRHGRDIDWTPRAFDAQRAEDAAERPHDRTCGCDDCTAEFHPGISGSFS